jgi:hypothetical protein
MRTTSDMSDTKIVTDFAGLSGSHQNRNYFLCAARRDYDLHLHLRNQIDLVLIAAIDLRVSFLPAMTVHLAGRHAVDPDALQSLLNFSEFERLNDSLNLFHLRFTHGPNVRKRFVASSKGVFGAATEREKRYGRNVSSECKAKDMKKS